MDSLGGVLHVRPGHARPNGLRSSRRDWAPVLAHGQPVVMVPGRLASAFSLCSHAHRLCAEMALGAAAGRPADASDVQRQTLRTETAREHLRQIGLAWPTQLAGSLPAHDVPASDAAAAEAVLSLRQCPLWQAAAEGADLTPTRRWLETDILKMPAADWLSRWVSQPAAWLGVWAEQTEGWLAHLLRGCRAEAERPLVAAQPLHLHADPLSLDAWAQTLAREPGFSRHPRWRGACAETGTWNRLHDPADPRPATAWWRLGARLADLVRLLLPTVPGRTGAAWLSCGACRLDDGAGLAWVETARGLLVHRMVIDSVTADARVVACQIVAPTEWNFDPQGAVAAALESLPNHAAAAPAVAVLLAAYDPCVRFEVDLSPEAAEVSHA